MEVGLHEDDLEDIIDKPINRVKSVEELRSHTIDENLNDFGKTIFLLSSNYEAQIIVGIQNIPILFTQDKSQCVHRILPKFKEICFLDETNRSMEFYQTINSTLTEILSAQLITAKDFSNYFLDMIANKIYTYSERVNDYENSEIFKYWTEIMLKVIEFLPESILKTLLSDSISKVKTQYSSRKSREYLSFLVAKCSTRVNSQTNANNLFPVLLDLCNDTQYEVRATACRALSTMSKSLGSELAMDLVVPEMFKFLCDESMLVRTNCFQSIIEILDLFQDPDAKNYLLKKIHSFVEYGLSTRDENYLLTVSKNLGQIIASFCDIMSSQVKLFFVDVFFQLCKNETLFSKRSANETKYNWNMCKINLANAFANVILITNSVNFESKLSQCLTSLVKDKNENVREAIALKMIQIAERLGPSQQHLIINDYCTSMTDNSVLVQTAIVNNLEKFLKLFIKPDLNGILTDSQQMPGWQLVLKKLLELENTISQSYKYSMHVLILESFSLLPWLVCTEILIDKILPVLEIRINARALPVRQASVKSMLIILRKIPRIQVRNYYFDKLIEFSTHRNCYKRIFFVEICRMVMDLYSKNFFKNYFYQQCIHLARDDVINVRISFLKIMVDLKKILRFQVDRDKLDNLEIIAKNLLHDKDKDVFELAQKAIVQMDFIKSFVNNDIEEKQNRIKEEEENFWFVLEPRKQKTDLNQSSKTSKLESPSATQVYKTVSNRNAPRLNKTNSINAKPNAKLEADRPQSTVEIHSKSFQNTEPWKRSQTIAMTEKPKSKSFQTSKNSITTEIYNSSSGSVNTRTPITTSVLKKK